MAVSFFTTVKSFVEFLERWRNSGGKLVDQNTANIRAEICYKCHNNKPSTEVRKGGICSACNKLGDYAINVIRSKIIQTRRTNYDSKLLTCSLCGCDNRISVWIPNQSLLNTEDANAYPTFCWKKKILENKEI